MITVNETVDAAVAGVTPDALVLHAREIGARRRWREMRDWGETMEVGDGA